MTRCVSHEFNGLSAKSLVAGLNSGQWTSVELTQYFLGRICKDDLAVHSVPFVFEAEALVQARESDVRRAAGRPLSSLDGLPMTIKDTLRVKDCPSTYGMWMFRNYRPQSDCELVDVLRKSGIVFLGRTAVPTGALDWNCKNNVYPECVNPFDPTRTPGGSSGGAAAALAMGFTPLELGGDTGGSIRYPAHCCGVYGLRTTDGWLPVGDIGPENYPSGFRQILSHGPMARHLEDLDLLLERFALRFLRKEMAQTFPTGPSLKIAYSLDLLKMSADQVTQNLFTAFLQRVAAAGHTITEAQPALNFEDLFRDWGIIAGHEYARLIPGWIRNGVTTRVYAWWILDRRLGSGPFTTYFKAGMLSTEAEYRQACERRKLIFDEIDQFFRTHDLWILPVAPSSAIPLSMCGRMIPTPNGLVEYSRYLGSYTIPTTMLGTPALAYPIGSDDAKMPIGVQIHGPRYADRWLVQAAARLER